MLAFIKIWFLEIAQSLGDRQTQVKIDASCLLRNHLPTKVSNTWWHFKYGRKNCFLHSHLQICLTIKT